MKCILATAVCMCLCLSVCLFLAAFPHYCTDPGVTCSTRGCPLVVQYWADLQPLHGFRCYDNTHVCKLIALYAANAYSAEREMPASACTRCMAGCYCRRMVSMRTHVVDCLSMTLSTKSTTFHSRYLVDTLSERDEIWHIE